EELAEGGSDQDRSDAAAALHNLALRLADADQMDAAQDAARRAVELFAALADADAAFQPRLAIAPTTAAQIATPARDLTEAERQARRAVRALRTLAEADLDRHGRAFAAALVCLSGCLAPPTGRRPTPVAAHQARQLAAEAVDRCRQLAAVSPGAHEPD